MISLSLHDLPICLALGLFILMGCGALVAPVLVTRQFGISDLTFAGRNEVRAVYGGFGLALAAMLGLAIWNPDLRAGICLTVSAALAGMAGGRLLSGLVDRRIDPLPAVYLGLEALMAGLLLYAA